MLKRGGVRERRRRRRRKRRRGAPPERVQQLVNTALILYRLPAHSTYTHPAVSRKPIGGKELDLGMA